MKLKLYLDMCVYNRPFDEQRQPRVIIETQICIMLLTMISEGRFDLVNSFALEYENSKNSDIENMMKISTILEYSTYYVQYEETILNRALEFEKLGLMGIDAVHIAYAERVRADFFITCDNRLIKKMQRIDDIGIKYCNIIDFISKEGFSR